MVEADVLGDSRKCLVEGLVVTLVVMVLQQMPTYLNDHSRFVGRLFNCVCIVPEP